MQQMKAGKKFAVLLPDAAFIVILLLCLTQRVSAQDGSGRLRQIPYSPTLRPLSGQTRTYFAFPFQKLKELVPELKGLKYDDNQERCLQSLPVWPRRLQMCCRGCQI
jgi:hypothetical protein